MGKLIRAIALTFFITLPTWAGPASASAPPLGLLSAGPVSSGVVALTFDGGPTPETALILAELKAAYVPATFFFAGIQIAAQPQIARAVVADGDEIGNGAYAGIDLQSFSTPGVVSQIERDQALVRRTAGVLPVWFRPPDGDVDARIGGIAQSVGLRPITWSIDSDDTTLASVTAITKIVVTNVHNGSVVVFHDGVQTDSYDLQALTAIIKTLKFRGFRFATLSELFGLEKLPVCVPGAPALFGLLGQAAVQSDPIYQTWYNRLCRGIELGPATSAETRKADGTLTQQFAKSGHQLIYDANTGKVRVTFTYDRGVQVFSALGIKPTTGDPITQAWFAQYFAGVNEGPAVGKEFRHGKLLIQRFRRAWAVQRKSGGPVQWVNARPF